MRVTTVSKATKESPSMLLFGVRQQGSVVDKLLDALEAGEHTDVSRDLIKTREQASDRMQESQDKQTRLRPEAQRSRKVCDRRQSSNDPKFRLYAWVIPKINPAL